MNGNWISIAVQIPIVVAFIYLVLEIMKRQEKAQDRRDIEWRMHLSNQGVVHASAIESLSSAVSKSTEEVAKINKAVTTQAAMTLYSIAHKADNGEKLSIKELADLLS